MTDYDIEEEHSSIPRTRQPGQITVVQPVQHQIVDTHPKYYKVGRQTDAHILLSSGGLVVATATRGSSNAVTTTNISTTATTTNFTKFSNSIIPL
jgi:hypothetical protein